MAELFDGLISGVKLGLDLLLPVFLLYLTIDLIYVGIRNALDAIRRC